jgi:hypothetical protein
VEEFIAPPANGISDKTAKPSNKCELLNSTTFFRVRRNATSRWQTAGSLATSANPVKPESL